MNKKAQHETIKALIGLVLVSMLMFVVIKFIVGVTSSLTDNRGHTERAFDSLMIDVDIVREAPNNYSSINYPMTIEDDYYIVAFDHDYQPQRMLLIDNNVYHKPTMCLDMACVCLYDDEPAPDEDDKNDNIIKCRNFQGEVYFSSLLYSHTFNYNIGAERVQRPVNNALMGISPQEYSRLAYSGQGGIILDPRSTMEKRIVIKDFKVQNLYIEKLRAGNIDYIMILVDDSLSHPTIAARETVLPKVVNPQPGGMI
ncbi:MAG: hypothetical protein DRN81_04240 [Thermoproteota archaeon]|nr:MAG: hypothetical protein DRN81_04240 [Candidatus Korarchaeota archaeon]